jgi:mitochondrial fission protein ELM1
MSKGTASAIMQVLVIIPLRVSRLPKLIQNKFSQRVPKHSMDEQIKRRPTEASFILEAGQREHPATYFLIASVFIEEALGMVSQLSFI